ncbi:MAG: 50S ribosomal protein L23 [Gammaproteobacteria bacterium]|jgi:large subunit ribosomal protein L23
MNEQRLMQLLLAPHISEKGTRIADAHRQVAFKVMRSARKPEIRRAVERMFNVEVQRVHVINVKGKRKSFAKRPGRRPDWKKAYVTLKPGHDIDFLGGD